MILMTVMVRVRSVRSTYYVPSPVWRVLTVVITKYLSRNNNVLGLELDSWDIMRGKRHTLYPCPSDLVT